MIQFHELIAQKTLINLKISVLIQSNRTFHDPTNTENHILLSFLLINI